ncbi:MAG TPA: hypothetical protein VMZ28_23775 [Kofleriaceae bacterium]|nr:hypothetical protein [Kofleriaceae bacterium]
MTVLGFRAGLPLLMAGCLSPPTAGGGGAGEDGGEAGRDGSPGGPTSLRFLNPDDDDSEGNFGVYVRLDPHVPADVGAGAFTIELWLKAESTHLTSEECPGGGAADAWFGAHGVIDRDIVNDGDHGDFGLSVSRLGAVFGVSDDSDGWVTCAPADLADDAWHFIAVVRDGPLLTVSVDAISTAEVEITDGDLSYRDERDNLGNELDPYLAVGGWKTVSMVTSFVGWVDELRFSRVARVIDGVPVAPFEVDDDTVALYRFDGEGDVVVDERGSSPGALVDESVFLDHEYSSDVPF